MIQHKVGNLIKEAPAGFIMHGCNAQGVMGSGFAPQVKNTWPNAYSEYAEQYLLGHRHFHPGEVIGKHIPELEMGAVIPVKVTDEIVILNAVTQRFFHGHPHAKRETLRHTDYEAIAVSLETINETHKLAFPDIQSTLHFPLIGCDRGGADWAIISVMIDIIVKDMGKVLWTLK